MRLTSIFVVVALGMPAMACAQSFYSFRHPDTPFGGVSPSSLSADGTIVAGNTLTHSDGGSADQPFVWTEADGLQTFADQDPFGGRAYEVTNISADGRTIGGVFILDGNFRPFIYSVGDGFRRIESISDPNRVIGFSGLSGDGTAGVGTDVDLDNFSLQAFRWTEETGMQQLGSLSGPDGFSQGYGISDNGSIVVGTTSHTGVTGSVPMRWTEAGGMEALGTDTGRANAVTPSGHVIVGELSDISNQEPNQAFRWTESSGIASLGAIPGGTGASIAHAVSADGTVTVGQSSSGVFDIDWEAVVWTETQGIRRLADILEHDLGMDMTGWQFVAIEDVSADGKTFVGDAFDPQGIRRGFFVTIPTPASAAMIPFACAVCTRRRR